MVCIVHMYVQYVWYSTANVVIQRPHLLNSHKYHGTLHIPELANHF